MIKITNTQLIENMPFSEYLQIDRVSFSSTKQAKQGFITTTPAMDLGTKVHNYLLEPQVYDYSRHDEVVKIANHLRPLLGDVIRLGQPELTVLADLEYQGMKLKYKGRIDIYLDMVIDLKISSMSLGGTIDYFGYDKQVSGYMLATGSERGMIVSYNKVKKNIDMQMITPDFDFWKRVIMVKGEPV
jgi:hypothetical protein